MSDSPSPIAPAGDAPLVTVIIRTRDRRALLEEALASVVGQAYRPLELVVVNDAGEDVADLLEGLEGDGLSCRYLALPSNVGRAAAANRGVAVASGRYVSFLDDDDLLTPAGLSRLVESASRHAGEVVYGQVVMRHFDADGTPLEDVPERRFATPFDRGLLLLENYIPFHALLFERRLFAEVGPLREELTLLEDWEFLLRLADRHPFRMIDEQVAIYRSFGASTAAGGRFSAQAQAQAVDWVRSLRWDEVTPELLRRYEAQLNGRFGEREGSYQWQIRELRTRGEECLAFLRSAESELEALRGYLAGCERARGETADFLRTAEELLAAERAQAEGLRSQLDETRARLADSGERLGVADGQLAQAREELAAVRRAEEGLAERLLRSERAVQRFMASPCGWLYRMAGNVKRILEGGK